MGYADDMIGSSRTHSDANKKDSFLLVIEAKLHAAVFLGYNVFPKVLLDFAPERTETMPHSPSLFR